MGGMRRDVILTFLNRVLQFLIGFGLSILLARVLGPEDRGKYALLLLFPTVLVKIGTLGIELSFVYFTANGKYRRRDLVENAISTSLMLGFVVLAVFWLLTYVEPLESYLARTDLQRLFLFLLVITLPGQILKQFLARFLLGGGRILSYNITDLFQVLFQVFFTWFFLVPLRMGLSGAIYGYIIALAIDLGMILFVTNRWEHIRIGFNLQLTRDAVGYGLKAYFGNIAQFLSYRLDMLLVSIILNNVAVGYYAIAVGLAERLWMIPNAVSTILLPRISSLMAGKKNRSNAITIGSSKMTLLMTLIASIILIFLSRPLILLFYGKEFSQSVYPFIILLPGIIMLSISKVLTSDLAGRGRPEFGAISSITCTVINMILNIFLIPKWGINGASFSSTITYSLSTIMVIVAFTRTSGVKVTELFLPRKADFYLIWDTLRLNIK